MSKLSDKQYAEILYKSTTELSGEKMKKAVLAFVEFLVKQKKLKRAKKIEAEFLNIADKAMGKLTINVESALPVSKDALEKLGGIFGENTKIKSVTNKELLGGIKIYTEEKIYDASLKTQILKLKKKLLN